MNTAPQPAGPPPASHPYNPGYPPPHASHTHNPGYPRSPYNAGPPASRHRPPEDELAAQLQDLALRGHSRRPSVPALSSAYSNPLPTRHDSLQQYPDRSNPAERTNPRPPRGPPSSGHNPPSSRTSWHGPDGPSWVPQQQPYPPPANTPQWPAPPPGSQPLRSISMNPPTTSPSHSYGQSPPQTYPINQGPTTDLLNGELRRHYRPSEEDAVVQKKKKKKKKKKKPVTPPVQAAGPSGAAHEMLKERAASDAYDAVTEPDSGEDSGESKDAPRFAVPEEVVGPPGAASDAYDAVTEPDSGEESGKSKDAPRICCSRGSCGASGRCLGCV
ncbi:hypothetical protein B0H16DRAFT_55715 [Mycena metata]|uniref:Uncharacterized protein n=1 Tax=Mycena metata TaxID=1033252 RepID=A0AAD7IDG5_9AGAR|nr:hypothetical protein B0H16DRAFT_55715 [Mycena metata]